MPADDVGGIGEIRRRPFGWKIDDVPGVEYSIISTVPMDEKGNLLRLE